MFTIGQFADLTGVSAKRLRNYDRLGLFPPAWVDPHTRYRFYSATQLPDLRRIVSLLDVGLSLADIAAVKGSAADLEQALRRRRRELEQQRIELNRRLATLDIRLHRAGDLDVVIRPRPRGQWVSLRSEVEAGTDLAPLFDRAELHAARHGARAPRPPACVVHRSAASTRDIELLIPVRGAVPDAEDLATVTTPRARVAAHLVVGGYGELPRVVAELEAWAASTDRTVTGPPWHVYLRFSADDYLSLPDQYLTDRREELVTEVQLPVA